MAERTDLELDLPPIVDESASADPAAAAESLELAGGDGDGSPDTPEGVSSSTEPPAPSDEKKTAGKGKPLFQAKPRGDGTYSANDFEKMRKDALVAHALDLQRKNRAHTERIEDLIRTTAIGGTPNGDLLDESIRDGVAAAVDTASNLAATKFGPAARLTSEQRACLVTPWTRVAKLYLGQYAQYSPLAAAALATVGVASEKWVDIQISSSSSPSTSFTERAPLERVS